MKVVLMSLSIVVFLVGCVSIPPQAVTSQELIVAGLESAKNNQLKLINAYADDQIDRIENSMENTVVDDVITSVLNGRSALPRGEVKGLLLEYAEDLRSKILVVESKRKSLIIETSNSYAQLISLAKANRDFLRSAHGAAAIQNDLIDKYKEKLKEVEVKIEKYVNK